VLGEAPHEVGCGTGCRSAWFSNWNSGNLTVVDAASRRVRARIRVGEEPHHFAAGAGAVWVTDNASGTLLRVELRSGRVRARTHVGSAPHHVAVAGADVLVAVHGTDEVALVSSAGRMQRRLRVGDGPHGIAAIP
jgi:DNA-binding beta-propeller fold protein YncE